MKDKSGSEPSAFIQLKIPAHGVAPPTLGVGLPVSEGGYSSHPHRQAQSFVSMKILDLVKLAIDINHHNGQM